MCSGEACSTGSQPGPRAGRHWTDVTTRRGPGTQSLPAGSTMLRQFLWALGPASRSSLMPWEHQQATGASPRGTILESQAEAAGLMTVSLFLVYQRAWPARCLPQL